jgi:hypothetical protein
MLTQVQQVLHGDAGKKWGAWFAVAGGVSVDSWGGVQLPGVLRLVGALICGGLAR